jgi:hypothetical protein
MSKGTDITANDDSGEPTSRVVSRLVEILGARLCAVIGDVKQTSIVREWIDGKETPFGRGRVLRSALRVAETIEGRCGSTVAQSWFQGANHSLSDETPALVLKRASRGAERERFGAEENVSHALREFLDI